MTTLSEYNNNPGNIRPAKGVTYEGLLGVDDKGFAIFEKPEYGQKALVNDLTYKLGKRGIKTPAEFVDVYSPAGKENNEEARDNYKIYIAQKLGLKSTNDPFPEKAVDKLAQAVTNFEGGTWQEKPKEESSVDTSSTDASVDPAGENGDTVAPKATSEIPGKSKANKPFLGIVGAGAGASLAGSLETGKKLLPLVPNIIGRMGGNAPGPTTVMTRGGLQSYLNGMIPSNVQLSLTELEKVSGVGKIRTMSEVQNALKAIQAVEEQKVAKPMVKMVEGRPGVFEQTGRFTTSSTPGKPAVSLAPYEVPDKGPVRAAIGRQLQTAGEVAKSVVPSVGRVGMGALGGANAVMTGYDAVELAKKIEDDKSRGVKHETYLGLTPDEWRLASKSAATVGGGLSMLPFGVTQGAGLVLQTPEMVLGGAESLSRAMKNADKEQIDRSLSSVDPMGNPMGGLP
jgi:hypothetical protein